MTEYETETPFVGALLLWLADHDLHQDARTAILARALGTALYEDFAGGPALQGAYSIIGDIVRTHALNQGVNP